MYNGYPLIIRVKGLSLHSHYLGFKWGLGKYLVWQTTLSVADCILKEISSSYHKSSLDFFPFCLGKEPLSDVRILGKIGPYISNIHEGTKWQIPWSSNIFSLKNKTVWAKSWNMLRSDFYRPSIISMHDCLLIKGYLWIHFDLNIKSFPNFLCRSWITGGLARKFWVTWIS